MLTLDQIVRLMDEVAERDLGGIEIERAGFRLRIDGRTPVPAAHYPPFFPSGHTVPQVSESGSQDGDSTGPVNGPDSTLPSPDVHVVKSPIVGTFFKAPAPDAHPFVRVGDTVSKGQIICIVEAMKLMNEIEADEGGEVVEIYARNGEPVEFGAPLLGLKRSKA